MTPDGISTEDWDRVHAAVVDIVNASAIEDEVLCAHHIQRLHDVLDELESHYGRIPSILGTRADFTDDRTLAIALHEEALAMDNDSDFIRMTLQSLIRLMIDERKNEELIASRLLDLERATEPDGDSFDLNELRDLRSAFERSKSERGRTPNA